MIPGHLLKHKTDDFALSVNKDKHYRSFIKAISWRAFGTADTILISWFIAGTFTIALAIGTFELITKTFLYYFHERLWDGIRWGRLKKQ